MKNSRLFPGRTELSGNEIMILLCCLALIPLGIWLSVVGYQLTEMPLLVRKIVGCLGAFITLLGGYGVFEVRRTNTSRKKLK